jgi:two-component system response regulator YesN
MHIRPDKVLLNLFLPYLVILVFAMGFSYIAYFEAFRGIEDAVRENHKIVLEKTIEDVDQALAEIQNLCYTVARNPDVARFLLVSDYLAPENHIHMREVQRNLPPYQITNSLVYDYFVHFKKSDVLMSPKELSFRLPPFYESSLKYQGYDYARWYDECFNRYHKDDILPPLQVVRDGTSVTLISYLQSIPIGYTDIYEGTILVLLREVELSRMLKSLLFAGQGRILVADAQGRIITSLDGSGESLHAETVPGTRSDDPYGYFETRLDGEKYHVSFMRSEKTGWTFTAAVPHSTLQRRVISIQRIAVAITVLTFLFGAIMIFAIAYRSSRPIRSAMRLLREGAGAGSGDDGGEANETGLGDLQSAVMRLVARSGEMADRLNRQEPLMRSFLFERLLRGDAADQTEMAEFRRMIGIGPEDRGFLCLVVHILGYHGSLDGETIRNLSMARIAVHDGIERTFKGYYQDIDIHQIAVLLRVGDKDAEAYRGDIHASIAPLVQDLRSRFKIDLAVSGGDPVPDLLLVYQSLNQARQTLPAGPYDPARGVHWYTAESSGNRYYFPIETETVLLNSLKSGNSQKVGAVVESLRRENFEARDLGSSMAKALFMEIRGTLIKLLNQKEGEAEETAILEELAADLERIDDPGSFFDALGKTCGTYCASVERKKKSHNTILIDQVLAYLERKYNQTDMGLAKAAQDIGLSEVYLSQFFKEQTGENFSVYLTKLRISQAGRLLKEERHLSILDVALRVGYTNVDTFRKAFKRINGTSPGEGR